MEDNNTLRKSPADLSSAWLLPLEILELLLSEAHPQVLVSFGQTCKELHEYLLKNDSSTMLVGLWYKSYTKHFLDDIGYDKQMSRELFIIRAKSLYRIARSMKFDIEDAPDVEKKFARTYYNEGYDPHELRKLESDAKNWRWNRLFSYYPDIEEFDFTKQYHSLTTAEKQAVKKFSVPKKTRPYKMPDVHQFSTFSIHLMSLWLARKATIHCMSKCGEHIQPTLVHDLAVTASFELLILCVIFKQEELYRKAIKEYIWASRGRYERPYKDPEFRQTYPQLAFALDMEESEVWKDTYSCRIVDWEKVHREHLQQMRLGLETKSRELEKMFGIQPSDDLSKNNDEH